MSERPAAEVPVRAPADDAEAGRRRARQVALVTVGCTVAAATATFGWAGLLAALSALAVVAGAVALAGVPAAPEPRLRRRPAPPVDNAPFRSYRQMAEALSWAEVSPRHYDLGTRPVLVRLLAARLADRHGLDLDADRDAVRALVGDDVWRWLDPDRDVDRRGQPPGVDLLTLERIIDRLESL